MEMASETTQNSALRTDEAASHGPLWRLIDCAVTAHANRAKVPVNRKAFDDLRGEGCSLLLQNKIKKPRP